MKTTILMFTAACAVVLLGCPVAQPGLCTPQSCGNGCCAPSGECVTAQSATECGLNGASCSVCGAGQECNLGTCQVPAATGGGGGATGGGGGATGGGGGATGGGGGGATDAGVDCDTVVLDPALGTLTLHNGATVLQAAALPAGIVTVGLVDSTLYGLGTDKQLKALGALPSLSAGAGLVSVVTPADLAADAGVFLGGYVAVSGTRLLAGYTRAGAGFPGSVVEFETVDGGARYVGAPGNYTAVGFGDRFLVNGGSLGAATGAGVYVLDGQGPFAFSTFEASWVASSGFTGATANGVLLLGYFSGSDYLNHVRAAPASLYGAPLQGRASFALMGANEVLAADDVMDLTTFGNDAILVRGGFDSSPPYASFTSRVERLPLTLSGSGVETVTAGAPVTLVAAGDRCTKVSFAVGNATTLLLGVEDRTGRRVLRLAP